VNAYVVKKYLKQPAFRVVTDTCSMHVNDSLLYLQYRAVICDAAASEEQVGGALQTEDVSKDDKEEKNGEPEETCIIEAADADDDNDEFVEWNEGDGNVDCFCSVAPCIHSNKNFMSV